MTDHEQKCYAKFVLGSDEPICGIHQVPLTPYSFAASDSNPPGTGHIESYICPVTQQSVLIAEGF